MRARGAGTEVHHAWRREMHSRFLFACLPVSQISWDLWKMLELVVLTPFVLGSLIWDLKHQADIGEKARALDVTTCP